MSNNRIPKGSVKILPDAALTFDDVLMLPRLATFGRDQGDTSTLLHPTIRLKIPILSSPMDTVTEQAMAVAMATAGGLGVIHRNLSVANQASIVRAVKAKKGDKATAAVDPSGHLLVGAAVGVGGDFQERVRALHEAKCDVIVVDSGHGHSTLIADSVRWIKKTFPRQVVMAGNVATKDGADAMIKAGADIIRVGMGPGSICTTRIVTGVGVPQLTAIFESVKAAKGKKATLVADGGIRQMGDIAKALAAGAHAVMLGSMLAGYEESPGDIITIEGKKFKQYRGMGSIAAMQKGSAARYGQRADTEAKKLIAEGVEGMVAFRGSALDFLFQASGSLRSALYYVGSKTIPELQKNAQFVRITRAGLAESHAHTITVAGTGANYMV